MASSPDESPAARHLPIWIMQGEQGSLGELEFHPDGDFSMQSLRMSQYSSFQWGEAVAKPAGAGRPMRIRVAADRTLCLRYLKGVWWSKEISEPRSSIPLERALELLSSGPDGVREWNALRPAGAAAPLLAGVDLSGCDLAGVRFEQVDLHGADLSHADLGHSRWVGVDLRLVDLTSTQLPGSSFVECDMRYLDALYSIFHRAALDRCLISGNLNSVDFSSVQMSGVRIGS